VIKRLEDAWNAADGAAFGAPFAPDADFVNIRGDLHSGREEIAAGHQQIFDSIYAGSTVRYTVLQERELDNRVVLAHVGGTLNAPTARSRARPRPSRASSWSATVRSTASRPSTTQWSPRDSRAGERAPTRSPPG